jgi:hypothetical protein
MDGLLRVTRVSGTQGIRVPGRMIRSAQRLPLTADRSASRNAPPFPDPVLPFHQ